MSIETKYKKIVCSGKRKTSVARAMISGGKGNVSINGKDSQTLQIFDRLKIAEPLKIAEQILGKVDFDLQVTIKGGGEKSQIDAARLAIAKAIVKFSSSKELEEAYMRYDKNLLVADIRRKETCKPGDSKARSQRQSSKR